MDVSLLIPVVISREFGKVTRYQKDVDDYIDEKIHMDVRYSTSSSGIVNFQPSVP